MAEIKTPIIKLKEGQLYIAGSEDYLITEYHTVADIMRFVVSLSDIDDIQYLIDEIREG